MRAHTPQNKEPARRRSSISIGGHRASIGSGLPVAKAPSRIGVARPSTTQPTYDFLTGAETSTRPPSRGSVFRQSGRTSSAGLREAPTAEPDGEAEKRRKENDDLKAEIKSLRYTIDNSKQEEELAKLRHESELREARRRGEEDFKQRQAAEAEKSKAIRQYEALLKEVTEVRDVATNEKATLERRIRDFEENKRSLEEEIEDVKSEREEGLRILERKSTELETRNEALQRTVEELQQDSDRRETLLQSAQQQLTDKTTAYGALEAEVLRLRAQTGDAETLGVIKRELSEQVAHIKKLEVFNRKQGAELEHFKKIHKGIEVVEEEKRSLQRKVDRMDDLQNELEEARFQRQRLEDEKLSWTAYLQSQAGADGEVEFDSPEGLARAFIEERVQRAVLVERLGAVEAELSGRDVINQTLEKEKSALVAEVEKLKSANAGNGGGSDGKAKLRLERQKALAIKEVEYLRAQLKAMDDEDITFNAENADEAKQKRIQELDDMVNQYREEVQTLQNELSSREAVPAPAVEVVGIKRPRDDSEDNERLGQLTRKNRKLQDELNALQASVKLLQTELSVTKENLAAANKQNKTRILSLRSNPTSDFEAIKMDTLNALRQENADLLAQLQPGTRSSTAKTVPMSTLEAAQREVKEIQAALASEKKMRERLRNACADKINEFREVVISLLGWNVMFLKSGKTTVTSHLYPKQGDNENSIEFDGEKGTMKVSGGPRSAFAQRIAEQTAFWVKERGSVPCFLAALTLEFYEEANRDKTLQVG